MFRHVGLSWMIETKEQDELYVEENFIEWCTRGPWFNFKTVKTYMAPYFSDSFFTSRQDIYDLMCGLRAYDKQNDKSTYAKK